MMIDDTAVAVFISYSARILRARSGGTGDSVASLSQQEAAPNTQLSHAASAARTILCVYEGRTLPAPAVHAKPVAYVPRTGGRATACPAVANQTPPFQRAAPTCAWMPATSPYRAAGPIVTGADDDRCHAAHFLSVSVVNYHHRIFLIRPESSPKVEVAPLPAACEAATVHVELPGCFRSPPHHHIALPRLRLAT